MTMVSYTITQNNLRIHRSYEYPKASMRGILDSIREVTPSSQVWYRHLHSMCEEWCVHNALYRLHIMRSHTRDVDLNYPHHFTWAYALLAPLARLIIP
nr:MAG TPA: hypothetical protein [Caudoviricetes sp.]